MDQSMQSMFLTITLGVIPLTVLIGVIMCLKGMSEISQIMRSTIRVSTMRNQRKVRSESQKNEKQKNERTQKSQSAGVKEEPIKVQQHGKNMLQSARKFDSFSQ
eukprot:5833480-Amphidinium_carterae.1